jgi:hypothetical protein
MVRSSRLLEGVSWICHKRAFSEAMINPEQNWLGGIINYYRWAGYFLLYCIVFGFLVRDSSHPVKYTLIFAGSVIAVG